MNLGLEGRFIRLALATGPAIPALFLLTGGWRASLAAALTFLLVSLDFLWMARGVRAFVSAGSEVRRGALRRALLAFGARSLLLFLGLYGILTVLPGEGIAAAAGIGGPLVLLAVSGAVASRG